MSHDVLFIYPYRNTSGGIFSHLPPNGIEHIAAAVQKHVNSTNIIDLRFEKDVAPFIKKETSLIGVSINWVDEKDEVRQFINTLPPNILTVIGGRVASTEVDDLFCACPNIDIIVRGDGEETMCDIVNDKPLETVDGISYRSNGSVIHNPYRALNNIQEFIYPDRRLRRNDYQLSLKGYDMGMSMDLMTGSRGCPYNCKFCTNSMDPFGIKQKWKARSPESIVQELKEVTSDLIMFTDENFCVDMDRVKALCDLIIKSGIKKKLSAQARLEIASRPDVLQKMQDAGFVYILTGIESPHDRILKELEKKTTQQEIRAAFNVFNQFKNMWFQGFFMIGNIGETEEEMKYISTFSHEIGLDVMAVQPIRCRPHTPLLETVKKTPNYYIGPDPLNILYSDQYSIDELHKIQKWIEKDFFNFHQIVKLTVKLLRTRLITQKVIFSLIKGIFKRLTIYL